MKAISIILFIFGIILLCVGIATMRTLNYLIPTIIGVFGLILMMIGLDIEETRACGDM